MDEKKRSGRPSGPPAMNDPKKESGWPGEAPAVDESRITEACTADIVVVGSGHAGVQCALAAAEGGASVIVIDPQKERDKIRFLGEQIGTFNSQYFIERGLGPYDEMEIIQEFCRLGAYRVNQSIISLYVRNSGEMLDHALSLIDDDSTLLDEDQVNIHKAYGDVTYPRVVGGLKTWPGALQFRGTLIDGRNEKRVGINQNSRLSEVEHYSVKRALELGAEWHCGYRAEELIKDGGRVTGVIAKGVDDGKYVRFNAKKAVCVTNGNTGDGHGHKMCVWAGGRMENTIRDGHMPYDASPPFGMTAFLVLNRRGERFCDESNPYNLAAQIFLTPKGQITSVFDSKWLEQLKAGGIQHSMPDMGHQGFIDQVTEDISHVVEHGAEGYTVRSMSASERQPSPLWGANTLEELADIMGYEGEARATFLESVKRYNEMCYNKKDEDFGKDSSTLIPIDQPPFYSGKAMNGQMINTSDNMCPSGIVTDINMNVIDINDEPIPGLYVAGNTLGNRYFLYYPTPTGGNMIGQAMTHGRVLGKLLTGQKFRR